MTNFERWAYYMKDIESPESYIDWGFYHLISSALQRRVWFYSNGDTKLPGDYSLFPNLYIILVGPPATGKSRVIAQESSIISHPDLIKVTDKGAMIKLIPRSPDKITLESLLKTIAEDTRLMDRFIEIDGKKIKQGYVYCPSAFLIEELEVLFAQNTNDTVTVLVHCYDSRNLHYKTKHQGENDIKNVCVSMIAGTTPDSIRDLMNTKIIKKGLTSRGIFIYEDSPRFFRQFPGINEQQRKAYTELVAHIKRLTDVFGEVVMTPEASKFHKEYYESGELYNKRVNKDPRLDYYYGRKNIHWLKMAMVLHFSEQHESFEISKETMEAALTVLAKAEVRMNETFISSGRNPVYESAIEMERYVTDKGRVPYKSLWWVFSRDLTKQQFDEAVELLVTTGKFNNDNGVFSVGGKKK